LAARTDLEPEKDEYGIVSEPETLFFEPTEQTYIYNLHAVLHVCRITKVTAE
jgi:hypothetical protein